MILDVDKIHRHLQIDEVAGIIVVVVDVGEYLVDLFKAFFEAFFISYAEVNRCEGDLGRVILGVDFLHAVDDFLVYGYYAEMGTIGRSDALELLDGVFENLFILAFDRFLLVEGEDAVDWEEIVGVDVECFAQIRFGVRVVAFGLFLGGQVEHLLPGYGVDVSIDNGLGRCGLQAEIHG